MSRDKGVASTESRPIMGKELFAPGFAGTRAPTATMISSNPGHCLWTRIVDPKRAESVAKHLLGDDLFTGWGVRTLSARERLYNPPRRVPARAGASVIPLSFGPPNGDSPNSREGPARPDVVSQPLRNVHAALAMLLFGLRGRLAAGSSARGSGADRARR